MKSKLQISKVNVLAVLSALSITACAGAGVSTNKTFMLETNNILPPNETNFFEVNLGLLGAAIAPGGECSVPRIGLCRN